MTGAQTSAADAVSADRPVISIVGPTATGKSDLAIALAQRLNGEIINADAMQFYRGMDIGTAKLPPAQRGGIPHHLLDILDVREEASVERFQAQARSLIGQMAARGATPILVGGSGLYVRAATDDITFPGTDPALRHRLEAIAAAGGTQPLHSQLAELDPTAAQKIAPADTRRVVRALEVIALTGEPFSAHLPDYRSLIPTVQIGLRDDRAALRARAAGRVRSMWEAGWVHEVRELRAQGLEEGRTASQAIGYRQILAHLDGRLSAVQAQEQTITRTGQFAKRQMTWFGRDPRISWINAQAENVGEQALSIYAAAVKQAGR